MSIQTLPALSVTPSSGAAEISTATPFSFRNKIINGDMAIDQRNNGSSQTITAAAALAYTVDRWYAYCTGANVTGQQVTGSNQTRKRYQFTGAASVTAIGFGTRLEAVNTYDLNNTTVTLSVDLANSLLTSVTWTLYRATTTDDTFGTLGAPTVTSLASGSFTGITSTVTRYSTQISIPAAATTGLQLVFTVGSQTSGTWTIGDVQLEAGSTATPFERLSTGLSLNLCQRYYYRITPGADGYVFGPGQAMTTSTALITVPFPVPLRIRPTVLEQTGTVTDYKLAATAGTPTVCATTAPTFSSNVLTDRYRGVSVFTTTAVMTLGGATYGTAANATAYLGWSAEL